MNIRQNENFRESWWVTNNTTKNIAIGDLLNLPVLKPGSPVDLLQFYSREKISHSIILTQLVKNGKISLTKDTNFRASDYITAANVDKAITPAEENEIGTGGTGTSGTSGTSGTGGTGSSIVADITEDNRMVKTVFNDPSVGPDGSLEQTRIVIDDDNNIILKAGMKIIFTG